MAARRSGAENFEGHALPRGRYELTPEARALMDAAVHAPPDAKGRPHPIAAHVAALRGMGVSLAELFELLGAAPEDGPMLGEIDIEYAAPMAEGVAYDVEARIARVERKQGGRIGPFDQVDVQAEISAEGAPAAVVVSRLILPRRAL